MTATEQFDPTCPVSMTPAALAHFEQQLHAVPGKLVRLSTRESGCTGYSYCLDLVDAPEPEDTVLTLSDTVTLAVSPEALTMVRGTEIDYVREGINSEVRFNNPNVVSECGCGESFSVQ